MLKMMNMINNKIHKIHNFLMRHNMMNHIIYIQKNYNLYN